MINVVVSGAKGRMGTCIVEAVAAADDLKLVGCFAPLNPGETVECADGVFECATDLAALLESVDADVLVDFSQPSAVLGNVVCALSHGVSVVTGTTGVSREQFEQAWRESSVDGAKLFYAPNFTTGAVLMMKFAEAAAPFFDDIEVIEMHHDGKKDAPSGTAVQTARLMAAARNGAVNVGPGSETEIAGFEGARGCEVEGVRVHAVRGAGFMASQEVILSVGGQTLTIRHDSTQRSAYMPGVLLAIRSIGGLADGFTVGLDSLMGV